MVVRGSSDSKPGGPRYRSSAERDFAEDLEGRGIPVVYEDTTITYTRAHKYVLDFELPNGILIEVKGWTKQWHSGADRTKILQVIKENPEKDIRIIWCNEAFANKPLRRGSKTTNRAWADKNDIQSAVAFVPQSWLDE